MHKKWERIIQIKYTASNTEGTGTITLSSLQVTNINYQTENVSDITKEVAIKNSTADDQIDDPAEDPAGNNGNKNTNDGKNTNSGISNGTNGATTSKTDTITSAKTLPYAEIMTKVVLPISIVLVVVISVGAYMGLRKYRGIK